MFLVEMLCTVMSLHHKILKVGLFTCNMLHVHDELEHDVEHHAVF